MNNLLERHANIRNHLANTSEFVVTEKRIKYYVTLKQIDIATGTFFNHVFDYWDMADVVDIKAQYAEYSKDAPYKSWGGQEYYFEISVEKKLEEYCGDD